MDFMDAVKVLWRRRLIVVAGILLTALGCAAVITQVQTMYQATGQYLLLLPAQATGKKNPQNPLINQPMGLIIAASLIAAEVNTPETQRELEEDGFTADGSLALAPDSGALLTIEVNDADAAATVAQRDEIIRRLDAELERIQTRDIPDIPDNQIIGSLVIAASDEPEAVPGAKIRALVVVGAIGAVLTLAAAFGLDRPMTRRRERRIARGAEPSAGPVSDEPAEPDRPAPRDGNDVTDDDPSQEPAPTTHRHPRRRR